MKKRDTFSTQIVSVGARKALELDAAELRVTKGPDKGARVALGANTVRIGSGPDCQLVLHDPTVSTHHAAVSSARRGYVVRDLDSKNGIFIGPWPVERAPLSDGVRLRLGETVLTVRALGKRQQLPLFEPGHLGPMPVFSLKMRVMAAALERYAQSDATVLIQGETGAGKEVAARALHQLGARRDQPFVVVDCGAIPPSLIAAELFGYERGAFTGAVSSRAGLFEEADGGTLFLDEIGELPLEVQPVLLRAIETGYLRRVGGAGDLRCDVRIIAATNRNCEEAVRSGELRADLYHRLAVGLLTVPSLRERPEDIAVLARVFADEHDVTLSPELMRLLHSHDWPGNVRELRNSVARAAAMPGLSPLGHETLTSAAGPRAPLPMGEARQRARDDFERDYLEHVLAYTDGNLSQAAKVAGISRSQLMRLASRHGKLARDRRRHES